VNTTIKNQFMQRQTKQRRYWQPRTVDAEQFVSRRLSEATVKEMDGRPLTAISELCGVRSTPATAGQGSLPCRLRKWRFFWGKIYPVIQFPAAL
jgi:hypothetical protein